MVDIVEEIFQNLKATIEKSNKYNAVVKKNVIDETYPLVVFNNNSNILSTITQDMYRMNKTRKLSFEISVIAINQENISGKQICEEISLLICRLMNEYYLMQGGLDAILEDINPSKATKSVLHFSYLYNNKVRVVKTK